MQKLTIEEMHRATVEEFRRQRKLPLCVVLDNVRSLHNVGSVLRTADAFALEAVWLCGITARPDALDCTARAELHKTALGAEESVCWHHTPSTHEALDRLEAEGWQLWALEQTHQSTPLHRLRVEAGERLALVVGNEVRGVEQSVVDRCRGALEIPQWGTKHSLNVSVSTGIALWEIVRGMI